MREPVRAITSIQFSWPPGDPTNKVRYRVDMPDVTSMIVLPDFTYLMVDKTKVRLPTAQEVADIMRWNRIPIAEKITS